MQKINESKGKFFKEKGQRRQTLTNRKMYFNTEFIKTGSSSVRNISQTSAIEQRQKHYGFLIYDREYNEMKLKGQCFQ